MYVYFQCLQDHRFQVFIYILTLKVEEQVEIVSLQVMALL